MAFGLEQGLFLALFQANLPGIAFVFGRPHPRWVLLNTGLELDRGCSGSFSTLIGGEGLWARAFGRRPRRRHDAEVDPQPFGESLRCQGGEGDGTGEKDETGSVRWVVLGSVCVWPFTSFTVCLRY